MRTRRYAVAVIVERLEQTRKSFHGLLQWVYGSVTREKAVVAVYPEHVI